MFDDILLKVKSYHEKTISIWGPCARGVDWSGEESQRIRFAQFLRLIDADSLNGASINDLGCGYGAFATYLDANGIACRYTGYDISPQNIKYALRERSNLSCVTAEFYNDSKIQAADYTFVSGIFNLKLETPEDEWLDYILSVLDEIDANSRLGFVFNLLSSFSDVGKCNPNLFYGNPAFFFEHCKRNYAFNVALLHDYSLCDFTVLVKKDVKK